MASIDEILKDLGVGVEKNATITNNLELKTEENLKSGLINGYEKVASTANQQGESIMDLQDFYNDYFDEGAEKTASVKTAADHSYELGELTGVFFNEKIASILEEVVMQKLADDNGDSAASQDAQKGPGLIPSGNVVDNGVNLPKNVAPNAAAPMDTTPEYYDLLDAAVAKKKVEKAIADAEIPNDLDHKTVQVDSGLEMPSKQDV